MRRAGRGGKAAWIALGAVGVIVVLLVLVQIFLPGIAANRVRSRVQRYGSVESVSVKAWPAVKLLWGKADSVDVRAGSLRLSQGQIGKLLGEAREAGSVQASARSVAAGPLQLQDATLQKHGSTLLGTAWASRAGHRHGAG